MADDDFAVFGSPHGDPEIGRLEKAGAQATKPCAPCNGVGTLPRPITQQYTGALAPVCPTCGGTGRVPA